MFWFIIIVLYICLVCALASNRAESVHRKEKSGNLPQTELKKDKPISKKSKEVYTGHSWLFELGF